MATTTQDPEERAKRKRRNRKRRLYFYGGLVLAAWGFYLWQPWEFDLIPRKIPIPNPSIDPDSARLFSPGTRVTIVTAHPDDSEFYMGGLLTKLHKSGAIISQIICTDGDKGYYPFEDYMANRKVRHAEALAAANVWGGKDVVFLGFADGRLRNDDQLRSTMLIQLQRQKPEYILAFDGDYPPRFSHQDHRRSGDAAEMVAKLVPSAKWLLKFSTIAPNYVVDITNEWEDQKKLLEIHKSQFHDERLVRVENMVGSNAEEDGDRIGVGMGEGLRCVRLRPYRLVTAIQIRF